MTAKRAPAPPKAALERVPMLVARIGGVLCMLLAAGCAGIGRAPDRETPRVTSVPVPTTSIEPAATPAVPPPAQPPAEATTAPPSAPVPAPPPAAPSAPVPTPPPAVAPKSLSDARPTAETPQATIAAAPAAPPAAPAGTAVPGAAKPASAPKAPAREPPAPAPAVERAPAPATAVAPPRAEATAPAVAKAAAPPPLDLKSLETRLRETKAIGVFTKLTVKNQVDDLLERFREFYKGRLKTTLAELRRAYEMLVLKVLALLQDADPPLASALAASRESIWGILSNPEKFSTL